MKRPTFKNFINLKETSDWKAESQAAPLIKGFIPPTSMRPIINAFLNSDKIVLMHDTGDKHVTMPKKSLYLVGGAVRNFIVGKSIKDYDLATNATPEQIGTILSAAGFKFAGDRSGKGGEELKLPAHFTDSEGEHRKIEPAQEDDKKTWFVKGRDNSKERKAFVVSAKVNEEEFEIATFRKDAKVDGSRTASVSFSDNPAEDASRRDFHINALYIELDKPNAENKKLFDPTGHGLHDLKNGVVRSIGNVAERFDEDNLRIFRSIRMHCKFGGAGELDKDIKQAIPKFLDNIKEKVSSERIREEFLKGLLDPDVDVRKYIALYRQTGLLKVVFTDLKFDSPDNVPVQMTDKKDKPLALAWLLQFNNSDDVAKALSHWQNEERSAVVFLLKLKEFHPDNINAFIKMRDGTGLSKQQIEEWSEMFKHPKHANKNLRPWWTNQVRKFAGYNRQVSWSHAQEMGHDVCDNCRGAGCEHCGGSGKLHPAKRGGVIDRLESEKFKGLT